MDAMGSSSLIGMKRAGVILLAAGVLCWLVAAGHWCRAKRRVEAERRHQPRIGQLALDLGRAGGWQEEKFVAERAGTHPLMLESVDPLGRPGGERFLGSLAIEVLNAKGSAVFRVSVNPSWFHHAMPSGIETTGVGDVKVGEVTQESWVIRARVAVPDPRFSGVRSLVYLQTPTRFDTRVYLLGTAAEVALIVFLGALFAIPGGILWQRAILLGGLRWILKGGRR